MNLGVYLPILQKDILNAVLAEIKQGLDGGKLRDASIFYDDVGPVDIHNVCGMFNAADLWRFEGTLVTFTPDSMLKAGAASNKFKTVYCHGLVQYDVLQLLSGLKAKHYLALSKEAESDFTRVTGKPVTAVCDGFKGLVKAVGGLR